MVENESRLQYEIVQRLQDLNVFCHSVPNEGAGKNAQIRQAHLTAMGLRSGVADLVVWWPDGIGYLEVKTQKGRQSELQKVFEKKCLECGICYEIVRSMEDLARICALHGVNKNTPA